jgi:hypothetical protein
VFRQVYTGIILPNTQTLSRFFDKKIAVVGLTKALADSQAFVDRSVSDAPRREPANVAPDTSKAGP